MTKAPTADPRADTGGPSRDSRPIVEFERLDDHPDFWTLVDVAERETAGLSDSEDSVVVVSRSTSPVAIEFSVPRFSNLGIHIPYPTVLPWFQFQDRYLDNAAVRDLLSQISPAKNAVQGDVHNKGVVLASAKLQGLAARGGLQRAAAEINKFMPQKSEGDHVVRVQALAGDDPVKAKQQEIELLAYQLSNDLIEDEGDRYMYEMDRSSKIMAIFNNIDLPLAAWKHFFMQSREETTVVAFTEKLFEAAVITRSISLCEALLESGADPDKPIRSPRDSSFVRPIQHAIQGDGDDTALAKLLVRFGARVDLTTAGHASPALLTAAKKGFTECVRVLVEAGAEIKPTPCEETSASRVRGETALSCAADGGWREGYRLENREGLKGLSCLKYLLSLHDPERDHEIIQNTLVVAARSHSTAMIPLLVEAGADVNEGIPNGHTPLTQAALSSPESNGISAIQTLLDLGADPNRPHGLPGTSNVCPLHIAAACGETNPIRLLVERGADLDAHAVPRAAGHGGVLAKTPLWLLMNGTWFLGGDQRPASALYMLRAGARLMGGELAPAPLLFDSDELVRELLARKADVNETDEWGRTALQNAIRFGKWHSVGALLEGGAEMRGGELITAIQGGDRATVEALLPHDAEIDSVLGSRSIMEAAASSKNLDFTIWLMEERSVPYHPVALCAAICTGLHQYGDNEKHLVALLRARDPNKKGGLLTATAIGHAAYWGDYWILDHLLTFKTQSTCLIPLSDSDGGYYRLTEGWDIEMADSYREPFWRGGPHIRTSILVPPILAANWDEARLLLDAGHKPDRLTLFVAVAVARIYDVIDDWDSDELEDHRNKSLRLVRRITKLLVLKDISQPARRNLPTPLQAAAKVRRVDVARHLLSLGVDVNAPPSRIIDLGDGEVSLPRTAFQAAVESGDVEMIDLLLDAGADIHAAPGRDSGATALQLAAGNGHIGIVRRLMGLGADVNAAGARRRGRTALQAAAEWGRLDTVQFLLECGVAATMDRSVESREAYWRARGLARRNGHVAVDGILQAYEERVAVAGLGSGFDTYDMPSDGSDESDVSCSSEEDTDDDGYYSPEDGLSDGDDEGWSEIPEEETV